MREQLSLGNAGWVLYQSDEVPAVFVRVAPADDGRLVVRELYVDAGSGLTTDLLRRIPFGRIEAECNGADLRSNIVAKLGVAGPDLRRAAAHFATTFSDWDKGPRPRLEPRHWIDRMFLAQRQDMAEPQAPEEDLPALTGTTPRPPTGRLAVPRGPKYPDSFYVKFASLWNDLVRADVSGPADWIAEANGVPVTTVHRWTKEARRRGILSPGRKGKVG